MELTKIDDPGQALALYAITPAQIKRQLKNFDDLKVVEADTKSYKEVRKALTTLVSTRTGVDKRRKKLGENLRSQLSCINQAGKMLIEPMAPYEERFKMELKVEDDRKAAIKAEKERKEKERVDTIRANIDEIKGLVIDTQGQSSDKILDTLINLEDLAITTDEFQELEEEAVVAYNTTFKSLEKAYQDRLAWEKEEADRKAESERLEKERVEQEKAAAALAEERKKIDEEKAKIKVEKWQADENRWRGRIERLRNAGWNGQEAFDNETEITIISYEDLINLPEPEFNTIAVIHNEKIEKRLEAVKKEQEEKEKEKKEREEAKEAMAPDKDKIVAFGNVIFDITVPSIKKKEAKELFAKALDNLYEIVHDLIGKAEAL